MDPESTQVFVVSTNIAIPTDIEIDGEVRITGIRKTSRLEGIAVNCCGVEGDLIGNAEHHGGPDQAVYVYSASDMEWWSLHEGLPATPGFYGENLTLNAWWDEVRIGDRMVFSDAVLEISAPRVPCRTLEVIAGKVDFKNTFYRAARPGAYARVIMAGIIHPSEIPAIIPAPLDNPTVIQAFRFWRNGEGGDRMLEALLKAPTAVRFRNKFVRKHGNEL